MDETRRTENVTFCCPKHGILNAPVEYISLDLRDRMLVDVPVMYCQKCDKYFTPCTDILAKYDVTYNMRPVAASENRARKRTRRLEVRFPYFMSFAEWREYDRRQRIEREKERQRQEQLHHELEQQKEQIKQQRIRLQKEKTQQYLDKLNSVPNDGIILTNKPCFVYEGKCPCCQQQVQTDHVKIEQEWRRPFLLANLKRCPACNKYYITPAQLYKLEAKANHKIHGHRPYPFVRPSNINLDSQEDGGFIFMPSEKVDYQKYDENHLPSRDDFYYDMTDEEYTWLKMLYRPINEEFPVQLRPQSFLGKAGYSTSESETRRHLILAQCVTDYGKNKVINQLKSNMNTKMMQKNGSVKYANALNIWRGDIWFVEHKL